MGVRLHALLKRLTPQLDAATRITLQSQRFQSQRQGLHIAQRGRRARRRSSWFGSGSSWSWRVAQRRQAASGHSEHLHLQLQGCTQGAHFFCVQMGGRSWTGNKTSGSARSLSTCWNGHAKDARPPYFVCSCWASCIASEATKQAMNASTSSWVNGGHIARASGRASS